MKDSCLAMMWLLLKSHGRERSLMHVRWWAIDYPKTQCARVLLVDTLTTGGRHWPPGTRRCKLTALVIDFCGATSQLACKVWVEWGILSVSGVIVDGVVRHSAFSELNFVDRASTLSGCHYLTVQHRLEEANLVELNSSCIFSVKHLNWRDTVSITHTQMLHIEHFIIFVLE